MAVGPSIAFAGADEAAGKGGRAEKYGQEWTVVWLLQIPPELLCDLSRPSDPGTVVATTWEWWIAPISYHRGHTTTATT